MRRGSNSSMGSIHLWSPFRWHHQRKGLTPTDTTSYSALWSLTSWLIACCPIGG